MLTRLDWSAAGDEVCELIHGANDDALSNFDIELFTRELLALCQSIDSNGNSVSRSAVIDNTAKVTNSIVMDDVNIHEGASVRDSILMPGSRVGHACEIARTIVGSRASLPRFNYCGSSIIGADVRFGGCVSLATRRFDSRDVELAAMGKKLPTNRMKFGSIVGERTILGFGVHVNPGITIGKDCLISPQIDLRTSIPDNQVVVANQKLSVRER